MTKAKTTAKSDTKAPALVFEEETFEHMGMIATMIGSVVHFIDRSYARSIGIVERNVHKTVKDTSLELGLYGTVHAARNLFALTGNGAKYPIKGYWLNADQMMIMAMKSSSAKAVAFRRRIVSLINDLREGRLVYRDNALVVRESNGQANLTASSAHRMDLAIDLSPGLEPVPEVLAWAQSFSPGLDLRNLKRPPREVTTDAGVTLHVEHGSLTPAISDVEAAMLASPEQALTIGALVKANASIFESHGPLRRRTIRNRLKGRRQSMEAHWPAVTKSPSSTRISRIRPAAFVAMSISTASMRPLPLAKPAGRSEGRSCC